MLHRERPGEPGCVGIHSITRAISGAHHLFRSRLNGPAGLALGPSGRLYISDANEPSVPVAVF